MATAARTIKAAALAGGVALALPASAPAQACDRPVQPWLFIGAWPVDSGSLRLTQSFIDEATVAPTEGMTQDGRTWRRVDADSLGRVNFNVILPQSSTDQMAAYALTYVASPAARRVSLIVESDDDVAVWLNGRRVHLRDVARGVGSGADTVRLDLVAGVNRLLYKVVNRSGGFGLGARLMSASEDAIADLAAATVPTVRATPSTAPVTVGYVAVAPRARMGASDLTVPVTVCLSRSAAWPAQGTIELAGAQVASPLDRPELVRAVTLEAPLGQLARNGGSASLRMRPTDARARAFDAPVTISADRLLDLLSRPIEVEWRYTVGDPAGAGAAWVVIDSATDSTAKARARGLRASLRVPDVLNRLTLRMDAAEFGPEGVVRVNGAVATPDSPGRVTLCSACAAGTTYTVDVEPRGKWWDPPVLRVADIGWREIREGAQWARYLGDTTVRMPTATEAAAALRALVSADENEYRRLIQSWIDGPLAAAIARAQRDTVDAVGNSHIDAAWLWRWRETQQVVEATWWTATKLLQRYPHMHFAASAAQYYVWLEQRDPALLERIRHYERTGRWHLVGGWWVEPDENMPSGESLVRQGLYGQRTFTRIFGHPARVAWTPDTFGYPWTLPQILRKSGFDYFVTQKLRWNDTNKWPARLNSFWWEGPDRTRIFTYIPYGYDHDLAAPSLAREYRATRDSSAQRRVMTLYGVGDHGGGPTIAMVERGRELARVPTFPVLRDANPAQSLDAMRREVASGGPVVRDELYLEYHRGVFTTQAHIKGWNRHMEGLLGAAEAAATAAHAYGIPYPREALTRAWERTLFNQFHDILPGSSIDSVYMDARVDYMRADTLARGVLEASVRALAGVHARRCAGAATRGCEGVRTYAVFNPSAVARDEVVRVPAERGPVRVAVQGAPERLLLADDMFGGTVEVRVRVPAFGTEIVEVRPPQAGDGAGRGAGANAGRSRLLLENPALRLEVDSATGNIARLHDRRRGIDVMRGGNALVLIEDRPRNWDAWDIDHLRGARTWVTDSVAITREARDAEAITVRRRAGRASVTQRYVLRPDRVDVETWVDWNESRRLLKAAFPMAFTVDSTYAEIPYGVIARPTRPQSRTDSARFETPHLRFVDMQARGGAHGVAVVNDAKYGYSASGDTLFLTLLRSPKWPDPRADMGIHRFTYSIVPHAGDWRAPAIRRVAAELNEPLRVVSLDGGAAAPAVTSRAREVPFVRLTGDATLGAVKIAEDDERVIVRLGEHRGEATSVTLTFASPVAAAAEVDMLERAIANGASITVRGSAVTMTLQPWEIRTVAVRLR